MNFTVLPEDHASHFPGSDGVELDLGIHNDTFQASSESFRNKLLSFLCNDKCIKRWEGEKITEKVLGESTIWLIILGMAVKCIEDMAYHQKVSSYPRLQQIPTVHKLQG